MEEELDGAKEEFRVEDNKTRLHKFLDWLRLYEIPINILLKVLLLLLTIVTLIFFIFQLNAIMEQNKAIWFGFRPRLRVNAVVPKTDIILDEEYSNIYWKQTGDSVELYSIIFTFENVGSSLGIIDSIGFEYLNDSLQKLKAIYVRQMLIASGATIRQPITELPLSKSVTSFIKLSMYYSWEEVAASTQLSPFVIHYRVEFEKNSWAAALLPKNEYDSTVSEILANMK